MPHLIYPIDAEFFHHHLRPALAECWRRRSFEPGRALCRDLLDKIRQFHDDYAGLAEKSLIEHVAEGLRFDRHVWRAVVGETLLFAAEELPLLQLAPASLACLLGDPGEAGPGAKSLIEQVLYGSRDLVFAGGYYRPDHAGFNDTDDVARLSEYLHGIDPRQWGADRLAALPELGDREGRMEELEFVRQNWAGLVEVYFDGRDRGRLLICEAE